MAKRRIKRFKGAPAAHRKDASQWVRAARSHLHRVRVHLAAHRCEAAMGSALDYARATGRFVEAKRGAKGASLPQRRAYQLTLTSSGSSLTSISHLGQKINACFKKERR